MNEGERILFLCKCNGNISNTVDFNKLKEWIKAKGGVDSVVTANLLCSPKEKEACSRYIRGKNIKSIVIAACSPKLHEKTFRDLAEAEGINIARVLMANIREQCAWVTRDKEEATEKAKSLINAAIERSRFAEDLKKKTMVVNTDVMVIGGGIAGIEAALTLSKAGRKVYLVEREISLGGSVIKTEEIAPEMECSPCLLAPLLAEVRDDNNIEILAYANINEIKGFFGNFTVSITEKARYVEDNCIGCEECFPVCPVSVDNAFNNSLNKRKAIYTLFPGSVPAAAVIDRENCKYFIDGSCKACAEICPFQSVNFEQEDVQKTIDVGSIFIATGFENFDPSGIHELGYGRLKNVYTLPDFERLASSNGPTSGKIALGNGGEPSSVAVIHCAGSMRENGLTYCSGICCTTALKVGEFLRKDNPKAAVYHLHKNLVFPGPDEYDFYEKQKRDGSKFIYCSELETLRVSEGKEGGKLTIKGEGIEPLEVDMVVLSTGLIPAAGTDTLAEMLNADVDERGYLLTDHKILHSTGSVLDGVYLTGCAAGPAGAPESVTRAKAACGDVLSKLIPGREIELEVMTAVIDEENCAGCKLCLVSCPYKAITFDTEKKVSVVNEAICRGCGTCAATCPIGACTAKHFSDLEIGAELEGILHA
ncbi:MAG: disulfide reductase [Spirochaetes bacterium]|nr:MAG: disulfide reductase [Spirochaetota bacterium]